MLQFRRFASWHLDYPRRNQRYSLPQMLLALIDYPHPWILVSEVEICWEFWSNALYQVDYLSELTTNMWVPLYTNILGNGLGMCVSDEVTQPQRFYRVVPATNQVPR